MKKLFSLFNRKILTNGLSRKENRELLREEKRAAKERKKKIQELRNFEEFIHQMAESKSQTIIHMETNMNETLDINLDEILPVRDLK